MVNLKFFKGKKVLITGHTGFKGTWLCNILIYAEANVVGYSQLPNAKPNLFELCRLEKKMKSIIGDIRDLDHLQRVFDEEQPEIVIHLAAQPLVRESYENPVNTYSTNVMGTVNVCECVRKCASVKSFLNVTTDKVYKNNEWEWGYRENEMLDGYDPYSNSKSCSELVTHSYKSAYFDDLDLPVSTARAGNVIGGGDFSNNRIIPDCIRAMELNQPIIVRNPFSIRPYQHVFEPLNAYLLIVSEQYLDSSKAGYYNVGPNEEDCLKTGDLVDLFCKSWGEGATWVNKSDDGPHEANFLKLDCSKLKHSLHWESSWNIEEAIKQTIAWSKMYLNNGNIEEFMIDQINEFFCKKENVNV